MRPDATQAEASAGAQLPRSSERSRMPSGTPARMTLPDKQSIFVTLHDISKGGCCVVRSGQLPLQEMDRVRIEVWNDDIQLKVSFPATVRWVTSLTMSSKAGLRFVDSSIKTHRYIEEYINRSTPPLT
jgi:c-di-GMP-binding flagellar brake protein YcgR